MFLFIQHFVLSGTDFSFFFSRTGPDATPHHPWRVAVGTAGHPEDRLVHQQQRRGEIQAAGEREQGAAKDHPGGEDFIYVTLNRRKYLCYYQTRASKFQTHIAHVRIS